MKRITTAFIATLFVAILLVSCKSKVANSSTSSSQTTTTQALDYSDATKPANRLFPDKLRYMPVAITAAHYPNPTYATYENGQYIWKHNTTIQTNEDLQLVEYGSFVYTEKGWYLRVSMNATDFEKYYNCKGGLLKKGVVYTDNASWRRGDTLTAGDAMWYYIAKDKNGNLVKGTAPIETEAKLVTATTKTASVVSSNISWTGYGEIGGYSLTGKVPLKNATIEMDGDSIKNATIVINVAALSHEDKNLEGHLKAEDFFEVAKYPTATFVTENITYQNAANATAKGTLTVKGITKPITIPLQISTANKATIIKGKIAVDRTAFGIKYNSKSFFGGLGDKAIKNNFDLGFEMEVK